MQLKKCLINVCLIILDNKNDLNFHLSATSCFLSLPLHCQSCGGVNVCLCMYVRVDARARARACVCVCVCVLEV